MKIDLFTADWLFTNVIIKRIKEYCHQSSDRHFYYLNGDLENFRKWWRKFFLTAYDIPLEKYRQYQNFAVDKFVELGIAIFAYPNNYQTPGVPKAPSYLRSCYINNDNYNQAAINDIDCIIQALRVNETDNRKNKFMRIILNTLEYLPRNLETIRQAKNQETCPFIINYLHSSPDDINLPQPIVEQIKEILLSIQTKSCVQRSMARDNIPGTTLQPFTFNFLKILKFSEQIAYNSDFSQDLKVIILKFFDKKLLKRVNYEDFIDKPIDFTKLYDYIVDLYHANSLYLKILLDFLDETPISTEKGSISKIFQVFKKLAYIAANEKTFSLIYGIRLEKNIDYLINHFNHRICNLLNMDYQQQTIEQVIDKFRQETEGKLDEVTLSAIRTEYQQFDSYSNQYKKCGDDELIADFKQQSINLTRATKGDIDKVATAKKCKLLAALSNLITRFFYIKPYTIQICAILAMLKFPPSQKGNIARIKTGEGKSVIVSKLFVTYAAAIGSFIDLFSSNEILAKRDFQETKEFLTSLGITSSNICKPNNELKASDFKAKIMYTNHASAQFAFLREGLAYDKIRCGRQFRIAVLDEVDSLFIDQAKNSSRIAEPCNVQHTWLYHDIYEFVNLQYNQFGQAAKMLLALTGVANLKAFTVSKYNDRDKLKRFSDLELTKWLLSAYSIISGEVAKGQNYIVRTDGSGSKISIVDFNKTGLIQESCRWSNGLHTFAEIHNGLKPKNDNYTSASISQSSFYGKYRNIFGVTATAGTEQERKEVKMVYGVNSINISPRLPSKLNMLAPIICHHTDLNTAPAAFREKIAVTVRRYAEQNRPVLVIFKTVKETKEFLNTIEALHSNNFKYQIYNDTQKTNGDIIVKNAGKSRMITIATNIAGRGTDIKPTEKALRAGGLIVILTFFPETRVELQIIGRAARNGQKGDAQMILSPILDPYLQSLGKGNFRPRQQTAEQYIASCIESRLQKEQLDSIARLKVANRESIKYYFLQQYFDNLARWQNSLTAKNFKLVLSKLQNHVFNFNSDYKIDNPNPNPNLNSNPGIGLGLGRFNNFFSSLFYCWGKEFSTYAKLGQEKGFDAIYRSTKEDINNFSKSKIISIFTKQLLASKKLVEHRIMQDWAIRYNKFDLIYESLPENNDLLINYHDKLHAIYKQFCCNYFNYIYCKSPIFALLFTFKVFNFGDVMKEFYREKMEIDKAYYESTVRPRIYQRRQELGNNIAQARIECGEKIRLYELHFSSLSKNIQQVQNFEEKLAEFKVSSMQAGSLLGNSISMNSQANALLENSSIHSRSESEVLQNFTNLNPWHRHIWQQKEKDIDNMKKDSASCQNILKFASWRLHLMSGLDEDYINQSKEHSLEHWKNTFNLTYQVRT